MSVGRDPGVFGELALFELADGSRESYVRLRAGEARAALLDDRWCPGLPGRLFPFLPVR
ncbi:MAG: hypothetical protein HY319_03265 [Armatimonadetes bacterium]|nr:hypothetical protein [Armatimonadota bacterium]